MGRQTIIRWKTMTRQRRFMDYKSGLWGMLQYMPHGGFHWVEPTLIGLEDLGDTSHIRRVYEVDIEYPENLHVEYNDLPFLPNDEMLLSSKIKKLMATLKEKTNYIIHYRNLKQAMANSHVVKKVHRVIQFNQSPWLNEYIGLNTEIRKKATNEFEKDSYKLMNNAVFDSLVYHIATKDFYADLLTRPGLLECTDTANLSRDHPGHREEEGTTSFLRLDRRAGNYRILIKLLLDYGMLLMFERDEYAKTNNIMLEDYYKMKEDPWIIYQDCNNLYEWAMLQPHGSFKWKFEAVDSEWANCKKGFAVLDISQDQNV
ncbi:DNA-directed DNA polymerase, family B, mitochondria/virus [Cinara cedri]|uniref:DNA-directed DNA polymerase n=1 Tax=Cinara cedri TaxID=506608 RepID=A0A5E4M8C8_9HEMI|nr:DNA-directed DNA polymerase, family B, mitochondria/virus [Cinara cedri]